MQSAPLAQQGNQQQQQWAAGARPDYDPAKPTLDASSHYPPQQGYQFNALSTAPYPT